MLGCWNAIQVVNLSFLISSSKFVFNGDLFNRGDHNIELAQELISLKKRYPERVVLIWGNHDLSTLQFVEQYPERKTNTQMTLWSWSNSG